jgi:5'-deoxynucleotidase YfbR-like HD superfamily hydrolase
MNSFRTLYEAGSVKRYHTQVTIKEQDLAAHQWGVAMICQEIYPGDIKLIKAALVHDLGESQTGDIPYTAKRLYPTLSEISDMAEEAFAKKHGIYTDLDDKESHCLRWADMFECYLFSRRESWMGNQTMRIIMDTARRALAEMGHPTDRAYQLFLEYHG